MHNPEFISAVLIVIILTPLFAFSRISKVEDLAEISNENTTPIPKGILEEDTLDGKFIQNIFQKWISPEAYWNLLNFPNVPNEEESKYLLTLSPPSYGTVDVSQYNLGLHEGLIDGSLPCACGRPLGRIVGAGGEPARINNIPWTSALAWKERQQPFCGATLINNQYVLTAGHCLVGKEPEDLQVWLNDENLLISNDTQGGRISLDVIEIKRHPQYKAYFNDIALLKLNETINLGSPIDFRLVSPACLPVENDHDYAGYLGVVAGWGKTSSLGKVSAALLKVKVPIWSNEECRRDSRYKESIRENMLCAGFKEGGKDACQGDSGGPLIIRQNVTSSDLEVVDDEGTAVLIGVVSWGFGCAEPRAPGVYTRVSIYIKWILENTQDAQYCQVQMGSKKF